MRLLAFDGQTGASGDMLLGALLAAGADRSALAPVEAALPIRYDVTTVEDHGINATRVRVVRTDAGGHDSSPTGSSDEDDIHGGEDPASPRESTETEASGHTHADGSTPDRGYTDVVRLVEEMDLPAVAENTALQAFECLGTAEASVHATDLDSTTFHEVGTDDAIADVVGVSLLVADLNVDRIVTTPVATGGGETTFSHGTYPVPVPAVIEIARSADWSIRGGPVDRELLTPTGAALLATLADGVGFIPQFRVTASGAGAGCIRLDDRPNVLRAFVGDESADPGGLVNDEITILETTVDDTTPEVLGGLQESLIEAGARDVSIVPVTMKKSRPGHLVKVICKPHDATQLARRLAVETGTLGVRETGGEHRWIAERRVDPVEISVGDEPYSVGVKYAQLDDGTVYDVSAEYEDAAKVAQQADTTVREVLQRAERVAHEMLAEQE